MSLLNGLSGLASGLSSFADDAATDAENKAAATSLLNRAPPPPAAAPTTTPPPAAGPRMPPGVNPYGDNPHAQALWLAEQAIVGPESGGRADAQNPVSSAGGKFQITDGTFTAALQKMGITPPASKQELDAMKYNPDLNTSVFRKINADAATALDAQRLPVTVQTLQAAQRLGPAGAVAAIRAAQQNPDAPLVGNGLSPAATKGNGDIAGLTVGDFLRAPYPRAGG
jgi:hypothetical protein